MWTYWLSYSLIWQTELASLTQMITTATPSTPAQCLSMLDMVLAGLVMWKLSVTLVATVSWNWSRSQIAMGGMVRWSKRKKVKFGVRGIALEKVLCKEVALLCSGCHNKTLQNEGLTEMCFLLVLESKPKVLAGLVSLKASLLAALSSCPHVAFPLHACISFYGQIPCS